MMKSAAPMKMKQMRDDDPQSAFFTCPKGHKLPHRTKRGRCAPFDCVEAKDGAHGVVRQEEKKNHAEALAYAESTAKLIEMRDGMRAWNEAHPLPEVPQPPKTNSIGEYMKKRLEQIAPLALERRVRIAMLDPGHQGEVAARELLNRSGYTERPEFQQTFNGPVFIVGDAKTIALQSPYAAQGKLSNTTHAEVIDGEVKRDAEGTDGREVRNVGGVAADVEVREELLDAGTSGEEDGSAETP